MKLKEKEKEKETILEGSLEILEKKRHTYYFTYTSYYTSHYTHT